MPTLVSANCKPARCAWEIARFERGKRVMCTRTRASLLEVERVGASHRGLWRQLQVLDLFRAEILEFAPDIVTAVPTTPSATDPTARRFTAIPFTEAHKAVRERKSFMFVLSRWKIFFRYALKSKKIKTLNSHAFYPGPGGRECRNRAHPGLD